MSKTVGQSALRAVPMTLFPAMDSLDEAVNFAYSKIPVVSQNEMLGLLVVYHNTLLKQLGIPPKKH